jgi:adenylyltransferase/sulfurtransferase
LCGRNAVQVRQSDRVDVDLEALANRLAASGPVECNEYLLRLKVDDFTLTVFSDGRAIIHGTDDLSLAKKLYAQYVGH